MWLVLSAARHLVAPLPPAAHVGARVPACRCAQPGEPHVAPPRRLPEHLAVIMDGNSRWAHRERRPRREGHWAGVEAIRRLVDGVLGLEHVGTLTVYAMSIENLLRRPADEVEWLLALFDRVVADEEAKLRARGVQLRFVGNLDLLPEPLRCRLLAAAARPLDVPQRLLLCIAVSYGGREEVARTARALARRVARGELRPEHVDEELFTATLHASDRGVPSDPDLLVRTGGHLRLSNFLLYQSAYTELVALDCLWPDFGAAELRQALDEYAHRSRNFGGRKEADDDWPMDASASPSGASGHNHRDGDGEAEGEGGGDGGGALLRADGVTDGVTDGGGAVRGG